MQHIKCQHSFSTMQEKYSYTVHPVITQNLIYRKKVLKSTGTQDILQGK